MCYLFKCAKCETVCQVKNAKVPKRLSSLNSQCVTFVDTEGGGVLLLLALILIVLFRISKLSPGSLQLIRRGSDNLVKVLVHAIKTNKSCHAVNDLKHDKIVSPEA